MYVLNTIKWFGFVTSCPARFARTSARRVPKAKLCGSGVSTLVIDISLQGAYIFVKKTPAMLGFLRKVLT